MTPPLVAENVEAPSLWRLLCKTPMRDVLRGRLTGRLDISGAIEHSGLPDSLQQTIRRTMGKTRFMWRLERADIARELIRHFQDAVEAGADPDDIAQKFGNPATVGALIRRAAKRKRPLPWHMARLIVLGSVWTIGLAIVVYLVQAARVYGTSPTVAVDYRIALNERARAVPDDQRAWPLYRKALIGLPRITPEGFYNRWPRPGEEGWADVGQFLAEHSEQLATARAAVELPGLGFVVGYEFAAADLDLWPDQQSYDGTHYDESGLIGVLLPHLAEMRRLARLLQIDAIRQAAAGNGAMAIADLRTMLAMAAHTREQPILINDLVAVSIAAMAFETFGEILADHAEVFSDDDLQALAHRIGAMNESSLSIRIRGERMAFADILQRTYSDDRDGNGFLTAEGFRVLESMMGFASGNNPAGLPDVALGASAPVLSALVIDRRTAMAEYDRFINEVIAVSEQPAWERDPTSINDTISEWSATPWTRLRYLPLVTFVPALTRLAWQMDKTMMQRDGVLIALAAELYRRRHGAWPESLDDMIPVMLPSVPIDRMTGEPMRFVIRGGRPLIYSVGSDREDDGGDRGELHERSAQQAPPRFPPGTRGTAAFEERIGDWILWPPVLEELVSHNDQH